MKNKEREITLSGQSQLCHFEYTLPILCKEAHQFQWNYSWNKVCLMIKLAELKSFEFSAKVQVSS